jgi:hypothetical protein
MRSSRFFHSALQITHGCGPDVSGYPHKLPEISDRPGRRIIGRVVGPMMRDGIGVPSVANAAFPSRDTFRPRYFAGRSARVLWEPFSSNLEAGRCASIDLPGRDTRCCPAPVPPFVRETTKFKTTTRQIVGRTFEVIVDKAGTAGSNPARRASFRRCTPVAETERHRGESPTSNHDSPTGRFLGPDVRGYRHLHERSRVRIPPCIARSSAW